MYGCERKKLPATFCSVTGVAVWSVHSHEVAKTMPCDHERVYCQATSCTPTLLDSMRGCTISVFTEFCSDGQEMAELENIAGTSCSPCAIGYYKNNAEGVDGRFQNCTMCPPEFITAGTGSTNVAACTVGNIPMH